MNREQFCFFIMGYSMGIIGMLAGMMTIYAGAWMAMMIK